MNIIIPIGGSGRRFSDDNYILPKPLIKSLGKSIIFWNLENLNVDSSDTIHIVYRKDFDFYNFRDLIENKFPNLKIKFIVIENDTRGASETVLYALNSMSGIDLAETTLVVDSDNFYKEDIVNTCKLSRESAIFYTIDKSESPIFSYITKDELDVVTSIKEKDKISDFACVGAYCFSSGNLLMDSIKRVLIKGDRERNEYYISDVYKNMIDSGEVVKAREIKDFICLGTPNQLKSFSCNFSGDTEKYRFCFDLDNTLVTYPKVKNDYSTVEPIQRNINFCNFLHEQGHTIIIYTARRMRTHHGNVGAVIGDISRVTIDTLDKFSIKYNELYFGKPYAHFYIDDLAIKSYDDLEKETGFYNIHPSTRNHNRIEIDGDHIVKYSLQIEGERYFYENIPASIINFFPKLIDSGKDFIRISRVEGIPISFLNTSLILSEKNLSNILEKIDLIHSSGEHENSEFLYSNYYSKFKERVDAYDFTKYENFEKISSGVLSFLKEYQDKKKGIFKVIHGDPVFTNILINNRDELKFIDMRGKVGKNKTIFGDIFYDYAKLYQSIIGYDFILMDKEMSVNHIEENKRIFKKFIIDKFGEERFEDIKMITKSLIISLIPIHDNIKCYDYFKLIDRI